MPKNHFLIIIILILFSACKSSIRKANVTSDTIHNKTKKPEYNDSLLKMYDVFLIKLDTVHIENSTSAALKYRELFKGKDKNTCDSAFLLFEKYYERLDNSLDNLHNKDTTIKYDSLINDSDGGYSRALSNELLSYATKLKDNGFRVYMSEGDTYIGSERNFIAKWFYSYISHDMKEYLVQLNKEEKEGFSEDAGLIIGPKSFVDRTVWWEKFVAKHPHSIIINTAKNNWKSYLSTLLRGMDNSSVLQYDQKTLNSYYKTAYSYLQNSFPATQTNKVINPYFRLLLKQDTIKANKLINEYEEKKAIE
jgi:hypothetical protein